MPDITTLVEDIFSLFDESKHHEPSEENLQALGSGVIEMVKRRLAERGEPGGTLRFSSLGRPDRQLWYQEHIKEKEGFNSKTLLKFLYGDLIEQLMLFLAKEAGHEVSHEQEEIEVDGVLGHIDAIIDGVVVDVKSASPYSFKKFKDGSLKEQGNDAFGYLQQISGYASVLTPDTGGAFLAADKVHGDITLLRIDPDTVKSYDTPARIEHLKEVLTEESEPAHCYQPIPEGKSGNMKLNVNCSYCAFKDFCWRESNGGRGLRKFIYSTGPVWLTHISKEPRAFEAI